VAMCLLFFLDNRKQSKTTSSLTSRSSTMDAAMPAPLFTIIQLTLRHLRSSTAAAPVQPPAYLTMRTTNQMSLNPHFLRIPDPPGRLKNRRIRMRIETADAAPAKLQKCDHCQQLTTHNKKTCKELIVGTLVGAQVARASRGRGRGHGRGHMQ
jgi:hypothetical protein